LGLGIIETLVTSPNRFPEFYLGSIQEDSVYKGAMISVDALNTQKEFAKKIIDAKAQYTLALKGKHKTLNEEVELLFATAKLDSTSLLFVSFR
jgi:hypothetical protein